MAKTSTKKRKSQPVPAKSRYLSKSSKKLKKSNDLYEAQDSDPDEERHAERYDHVDNYEYEMPSDFEDEEIDEDLAFTEEDKKKYAGWFGEEPDADEQDEQQEKHNRKRVRSEFADLDSSEEEEQEDEDEEVIFDEGEDDYADDDDMHQQQLGSDADGEQEQQSGSGGEEGSGGAEAEFGSSSEEEDGGSSEDDDIDDFDDDRHRAMVAAALGKDLAAATAPDRRKKVPAAARNAVVAEAYNESEAHATTGGAGELRLADLLDGLSAGAGGSLGGARKLLEKLDKKGQPVAAPLPRTVADRLERKAGYEDTKKEVTKWQPIVKSNREAPTLRFTSARHEVSAAAASTSALVDSFTPSTDDPEGLEAQVAALLGAAGTAGAAAMEEADLALAEKHYSLEEAKARADRLAKMRHLLFYAELKAKRLAKIKSKEHHRRANKAAKRAAARLAEAAGDEAEAHRQAEQDAEFERAKERLTLKHKNSSKWARRALKRGQASMDPSMREAIAAQLQLGQQLRRKIEGGRGSGSEGSGDSEGSTSASDDEGPDGQAGAASTGRMMSSRNRKEALAILKGLADPTADGEAALAGDNAAAAAPKKKGLFALPFMVRALEKQRAAAAQEAAALLGDLEGSAGVADAADAASADAGFGGRMSFGGTAAAGAAAAAARVAALEQELSGSDGEEDVDAKAERLSRHIAGEAATAAVQPAEARQQQQSQQIAGYRIAAGQQQQPDVGFVEIDLPHGQEAAAGKGSSKKIEQAVGSVHAAANGSAAPADVHSGLFAGRKQKQKQQQQQQQEQQPAFLSSKSWQGPKPGYVFKKDKQGVGYYIDKQQQQGQKRGEAKGQQQQQQNANVQQLLQRQQQQDQEQEGSDSAADDRQQQQQQMRKADKQTGAKNAPHAAAPAATPAAAGVDAMQLLSSEGDLQRQLLQAAFAGDDVAAEFEAAKAAEVAAELPSADAEGQLPGWGTWAGQQKEPAWMVAAKAKAAAKREAAAAGRKDAQLKAVVISEKWDKKSSKYLAPSLPFPFKDKAVYESAIRQPLGRQYNPDAAFRNLTRPAVLKDTGVVIEPLRFSKQVEQYNAKAESKGRAVVTVAGGMQLQGQAAGTGAGGVGKGGGKKAKQQGGAGKGKAAAATGSQKRLRLHDGAGR